MTAARRLRRLTALVALAAAGLAIQSLAFPFLSTAARRATIRRWSALLVDACGLTMIVDDAGAAASRPLADIAPGRMLVANHVSWLDVFAINALTASAFVAKAELRRWPAIGWLVTMSGTVFIERGRRHAVRAVIDRLAERIRDRYPVALFPEATTHAGPGLLPFHANLLEAAIGTGAEVIPIALEYRSADGRAGVAAHYVGETSFIASLWAIVGARGLCVRISVLPALPADGAQRHALARELRARIAGALSGPPPGSPPFGSPPLSPASGSGPGKAGGPPAASR